MKKFIKKANPPSFFMELDFSSCRIDDLITALAEFNPSFFQDHPLKSEVPLYSQASSTLSTGRIRLDALTQHAGRAGRITRDEHRSIASYFTRAFPLIESMALLFSDGRDLLAENYRQHPEDVDIAIDSVLRQLLLQTTINLAFVDGAVGYPFPKERLPDGGNDAISLALDALNPSLNNYAPKLIPLPLFFSGAKKIIQSNLRLWVYDAAAMGNLEKIYDAEQRLQTSYRRVDPSSLLFNRGGGC